MQKLPNSDPLFTTTQMAPFVRRLQIIGLVGYLGVALYYPILFFYLDPHFSSLAYISLAMFWMPLTFALKGLYMGNPYTYAWSNFVIMWCFLHGLTALWTFEGAKLYVVLEVALLTLAFIGNTYFARYRGRELGLALPKIKELKAEEKKRFEG